MRRMDKIIVSKVEKYDIRSCNSCYARNYKSNFDNLNLGEYTEQLYSLQIGQLDSCLCKKCLEKVVTNIVEFLGKEKLQ